MKPLKYSFPWLNGCCTNCLVVLTAFNPRMYRGRGGGSHESPHKFVSTLWKDYLHWLCFWVFYSVAKPSSRNGPCHVNDLRANLLARGWSDVFWLVGLSSSQCGHVFAKSVRSISVYRQYYMPSRRYDFFLWVFENFEKFGISKRSCNIQTSMKDIYQAFSPSLPKAPFV